MIDTSPFYPCFHIIPLSYDESLSYYEFLCKVNVKLNELIEAFNKYNTDYENAIKKAVETANLYTDTEIAKYKENVDKSMLDLKTYIDDINEQMKIYVRDEINNIFVNDISVYNPTNGLFESIGTVLSDIYDFARYDALTALAYDNYNYTAKTYDDFNITTKDYDTKGKTILANI